MKRHIKTMLGVVISGALIYWLATSDAIDWSDAWQRILAANPWLLLLSSAAATGIFAIRAPRWRVILGDAGHGVRFSSLWEGCVIGQMLTNVVPLRAGEFGRAYTLSRHEPTVPFSTALGSVLIDRVFDGIVMLLLIAVAMLDPRFPAVAKIGDIPLSTFVIGPLIALLVGLGGAFALAVTPTTFLRVYHRVARLVIPRWEMAGAAFLERFAHGLAVLRSPRRFLLVLGWTLLHWLVCAFSIWLGLRAFGVDVPASAALFTMGIIVLSVALPSAPGFVGVMEFGAILALNVYGIDRTESTAFIVAYHAVSYVPVTALGVIYLFRMGLRLSDVRPEPAPS